MSFKYNKLRGRIVEICGTQGNFAKELGQAEQLVTAKLAGRSSFSQSDIIKWCQILKIDREDIGNYFFVQ